jgi:HEAT repeat protein
MLWWTLRTLRSRDADARERAANALGERREPKAVPHLVRALDDPNELVAVYAAIALGKIGDARAIAPLITCIPRVGGAAGFALRDIDPAWPRSAAYEEAWPRLLACLADHRSAEARNVFEALAIADEPRILAPLAEVLRDRDCGSDLQSLAIRTVSRSGRAALEPLLACLSGAPDRYGDLLDELAGIDRRWQDTPAGAAAIAALVTRLHDPRAGGRGRVVGILEKLCDPRLPDWLAPVLADWDIGMRRLVGHLDRGLWTRLSAEGVRALVDAFAKDPFPEAIPALAAVKDRVLSMLNAGPEHCFEAALALAGLDHPDAILPLLALLGDRQHPLRGQAPILLARFGNKKVFDALADTLLRPEAFDRHAVIFSLAAVAGSYARPALEEYLARDPSSDRAAAELALQILPAADETVDDPDRALLRSLTDPWRLHTTERGGEVFADLSRRFPSEAACALIARDLSCYTYLEERRLRDYEHLLVEAGRTMDPEKLEALVRFEAQNWPQVSRNVAARAAAGRL